METVTFTAEVNIINDILSIIKDFPKNEQFFITIRDNDDIIF